jgi:MoxR-like ATPase
MDYIFSPSLGTFLDLALARMRAGHGATLLLEGPPGGGKTAFAKAVAARLGATLHYYAGAPDRERDLLYEVDVHGVVTRTGAWVPGPAWEAFAASAAGRPAVLLVDEADKTAPGFDAFLLRLLEEGEFRAPDGSTITADPAHLAVILTSNGRRALRPEVLRRCQRITVPRPDRSRQAAIVRQLTGPGVPAALLSLLIRIGDAVHAASPEQAPSPKEIALCALDLLTLSRDGDPEVPVIREVAASWLVKGGGPEAVDRAVPGFKWARALRTEATACKAAA